MSKKRFQVVLIEFNEENKKNAKALYSEIASCVSSKFGESKVIYDGNDERIIAALEKVLKLAENDQ